MDGMVYSALRRKLAAAQAVGDIERIDRLRGMMAVSLPTSSPVPALVVEIVEPEPGIDQAVDSADLLEPVEPDVEATVDTDE